MPTLAELIQTQPAAGKLNHEVARYEIECENNRMQTANLKSDCLPFMEERPRIKHLMNDRQILVKSDRVWKQNRVEVIH